MSKNILIIAGEPSGDIRAGELLVELKKILPDTSLWGIGGDQMKALNVELIEHIRNLSIIGIWDVIKNLLKIRKQYKNVTRNIQKRKPDLAILVDYPGFNLKVAKFLHKMNIPVVYYIIPQVWAWGGWRIKHLKKYINKSLVLFKFEEDLLLQHGINCTFVGHPIVDKIHQEHSTLFQTGFGTKSVPNPVWNNVDKDKPRPTIALLPGSRKSEIQNIFPAMLNASEKINKELGGVDFILAASSNVDNVLYDAVIDNHKSLSLTRVLDNTTEALSKSDFAIVTSGTATLETTIMEVPMVILYHATALTIFLVHTFTKTYHIGFVNIIGKKEIAPEIWQAKKKNAPELIAKKVLEIMKDTPRMQQIKDDLRKVKNTLGEPGASKRTANFIRGQVLYL